MMENRHRKYREHLQELDLEIIEASVIKEVKTVEQPTLFNKTISGNK